MRKITDKLKCGGCRNVKNGAEFYHNKKSGTMQSWCKQCTIKSSTLTRNKARKDCIEAYGSKCSCCGEENYEFLSIDHIGGGGKEHRKLKHTRVYFDIRKQGYPKDKFRLLCYNCNLSFGFYKYCPHQKL